MDGEDASAVFTSSGSVDFKEHNDWTPMLELLFMWRLAAPSRFSLKKLTWRESRFLVTLLLTYHVTKRMLTVPFNASLGTIAFGAHLFVGVYV